jgi:hypothetical protein
MADYTTNDKGIEPAAHRIGLAAMTEVMDRRVYPDSEGLHSGASGTRK